MRSAIIEKIKDDVKCTDYMERIHGVNIRPGGRCRSFRPDATNPTSLLVNERDWYDYGAGVGGDVIDLCANDRFGGSKGKAISFLCDEWHIDRPGIPDFVLDFDNYGEILDAAVRHWHDSLTPEHRDYFHGRGISDKTIDELMLGWTTNVMPVLTGKGFLPEKINDAGVTKWINRYSIPYLRNGKTVYIIARKSDLYESDNQAAKYEKLFRNDMSEHPIWGFDTLRREGTVYIAEGAFDAISLYQEGYPVVSAITGAFSTEQKKDLFPALSKRDVVVCMDYDPVTKAGQKFTERLAEELFEEGIHVSVCLLHGGENKIDISEIYAKNPCRETIEKIFSDTKEWSDVKVRRISEISGETERKGKLVEFLRRCASTLDWPTVAQVAAGASSTGAFHPVWLKETVKSIRTPPSELEVVERLAENQDLCYHPALGWHRWDGTVWGMVDELEVKSRVSKIYGKFQTDRNTSSVAKLARVHFLRTDLFNMEKDLINFPNGMLDMKTMELKPHSRDYFSSVQMQYEYDADAACPAWARFIDDITNGEEDQQLCLQEMFGYCLTRDARYQKCFCLVGNGSNGKSVLLSVLEAMVGSVNCSHVEIAYLNNDFQRIKLLNSQVNICNDMRSDVAGSESFLKACVAGDPISACYKGKDFVDFKPYAKFVFAVNELPTARDVGYGFRRRFVFFSFPLCFRDAPRPNEPNDRKRDAGITEKLLAELPGILNWSLAGLKALRERGSFTSTTHQAELSLTLTGLSDTVFAFVDDTFSGDGWIYQDNNRFLLGKGEYMVKKAIYDQYTKWCEENGVRQLTSQMFWPRLRKVYPYEEKKTLAGRAVRFLREPFSPEVFESNG